MTGQTGSGQARLTLGGSNRRCTTGLEWSPAERFASGSAQQAISAACNKAVCREAVCSSFTLFAPPAHHQPIRHRGLNDEYKYSLTKEEVPVKVRSPCKGLAGILKRVQVVLGFHRPSKLDPSDVREGSTRAKFPKPPLTLVEGARDPHQD